MLFDASDQRACTIFCYKAAIRLAVKKELIGKVDIKALNNILAEIMEQAEGQYSDWPRVGQDNKFNKMENQVIKNLSSFIYQKAVQENDELIKLCDYGLKKMPELAFAYQCGKEIYRLREIMLESVEYRWEREYTIEQSSGPSDLVFLIDDDQLPNYVIEFKLDATWYKYKGDIDKLKAIKNDKWVKLFCSFKHVFIEQEKDVDQAVDFLKTLKDEFGNKAQLVGEEKVFHTVVNSKHKDRFLYTFWKVF